MSSRVQSDFAALLKRIERRLYPETTDALAFFWMKTVYHNGYGPEEWNELDQLLQDGPRFALFAPEAHQAIAEMRIHLREEGLLSGRAAPPMKWKAARRAAPDPDQLGPYFARLLNEWLPKEVARLSIEEPNPEERARSGVPVAAMSEGLLGLLRREGLCGRTLEFLLQPGKFSAREVYPLEFEILRDAALFLLGRTEAPDFPVPPARLLCVAPGARLTPEYSDDVRNATLVQAAGGEELLVPIAQSQAVELLLEDQCRVASMVVTMDGRWWLAYQLQRGLQNGIIYRPAGRLRIDYSGEPVRLRVRWLESRLNWSGPLQFPAPQLFGRQWRVARWEQDAEHTFLDLISAAPIHAAVHQRRARPAFVDMDWAAMENALAASVRQRSGEPVEQLRREHLVPLGRSILALEELARRRRLCTPEAIETRLSALAFHAGSLQPEYGRIPWRILPGKVRGVLLGRDLYPHLAGRLNALFQGVPDQEAMPAAARQFGKLWHRRPTQAA